MRSLNKSKLEQKLGKIKALWRKANAFAEEAYNAPYRSAIARAKREQDDLFMLMVYSELMGIPNPFYVFLHAFFWGWSAALAFLFVVW